jgi:hypothetical protein
MDLRFDAFFWEAAWRRVERAEGHLPCECDQCSADDAESYAIYVLDDHRALMWETYRRNHPDGQP